MARKKHKQQGHYCKICDSYKANEKFSGKGHAAHICQACSKLSAEEKAEALTANKIQQMAFRRVSDAEMKWLRAQLANKNPAIQQAAREVHEIKCPHYERNMLKKGIMLHSIEFYIHCDIYDSWGDCILAHLRLYANRTGTARRTDYNSAGSEGCAQEIKLPQHFAQKLMKAIVHEYEAPFWGEDFRDLFDDEYRDEYDLFDDDDDEQISILETPPNNNDAEPMWTVCLEKTDGTKMSFAFYNEPGDRPLMLFEALNELFMDDEGSMEYAEEDEGC